MSLDSFSKLHCGVSSLISRTYAKNTPFVIIIIEKILGLFNIIFFCHLQVLYCNVSIFILFYLHLNLTLPTQLTYPTNLPNQTSLKIIIILCKINRPREYFATWIFFVKSPSLWISVIKDATHREHQDTRPESVKKTFSSFSSKQNK